MSERSRMIDLTAPVERAFLIGLDNPRDGRWPVGRSLAELKGQNLILQIDDGPALGVVIVHVEGTGPDEEVVLNLSPK